MLGTTRPVKGPQQVCKAKVNPCIRTNSIIAATTSAHAVLGAQVLRCVDWGDAREARAAVELVARWAPIGLADALELLSPAFTNPEVGKQRRSSLHILSFPRLCHQPTCRGELLSSCLASCMLSHKRAPSAAPKTAK